VVGAGESTGAMMPCCPKVLLWEAWLLVYPYSALAPTPAWNAFGKKGLGGKFLISVRIQYHSP
jgi:hypothetical protein